MLKKVIKFTDFDGNERSMDAYFNLNNTEILKWLVTDGDYSMRDKIVKLFVDRNGREIMSTFEELIDTSYGEKSLDGIHFMKSPEILAKFKSSPAYDSLFMELVTDSSKAADFFNAVVPKDMAERMKQLVANGELANDETLPDEMKEILVAGA